RPSSERRSPSSDMPPASAASLDGQVRSRDRRATQWERTPHTARQPGAAFRAPKMSPRVGDADVVVGFGIAAQAARESSSPFRRRSFVINPMSSQDRASTCLALYPLERSSL